MHDLAFEVGDVALAQHFVQLPILQLARFVLVDLVKQRVHRLARRVKADRLDGAPPLVAVDGPAGVDVPQAKDVADPRRGARECVSQRLPQILLVRDLARPVDVVVGEDRVTHRPIEGVVLRARQSKGLGRAKELVLLNRARLVAVPLLEQVADLRQVRGERLPQLLDCGLVAGQWRRRLVPPAQLRGQGHRAPPLRGAPSLGRATRPHIWRGRRQRRHAGRSRRCAAIWRRWRRHGHTKRRRAMRRLEARHRLLQSKRHAATCLTVLKRLSKLKAPVRLPPSERRALAVASDSVRRGAAHRKSTRRSTLQYIVAGGK